jgi:3-oxoacyl-[acyl-carrier-protein] synthase-3
MSRAAIIGTGFYVPDNVVTNDDLSRMMDTSDEWITERSGIKERRWLPIGPDGHTVMTGAEMGAAAGRMAMEAANLTPADIDQVIFATLNPDVFFPGNGVFIEDLLGLKTAGAMDIRNQCTGFVYGLAAADGFIRAGTAQTVLLIGGEVQSSALETTNRGRDTAVLFGDGAGAAIVQAVPETSQETQRGILASVLHSQGRYARELYVEAPVATVRERITPQMMKDRRHLPTMNGPTVFKHATRRFCEAITEVLEKGGYSADQVDLLVPHQANQRITDAVAQRMEMGPERVFSNIAKYGNTTAATIPIALAEAEREGRLKPGHLVVTVAFGSGFTWGANLIRW